ncbi:MAG: RNA polymerase sigma factor [Acidobacteriota bacterium]
MVVTGLVEQAQHGDRDAFEAFASSVLDDLYSAAVLMVHDPALAEDAAQEALVRAWRGLPRLRDPGRVRPWLYRILLNACADTARQARSGGITAQTLEWVEADGRFELEIERRDAIARCLARLTPRQRGVLILRYFVGLSVPEVAAASGVPVGTAKSRLHGALNALRAALDADARPATQGGLA